jgi:cytochrome P450
MSTTPPGPKGLPVVGNSYHYAQDPLRFMTAVRDAYGDIAQFTLGPEQAYMLTNPEDIERVLVSDEDAYRKPQFQADTLGNLLGDGLLLSEGGTWKRERQRMQPAFLRNRLDDCAGLMAEYAAEMATGWDTGETIQVDIEMAKVTLQIITSAMMGVELDDATIERVQESLQPVGDQFSPTIRGFLMPEWMPTREQREYRQSIDVLEDVLRDVLRDRQGPHADGPDMLSLLFGAQSESAEVDRELIRDEMMTMLLAGHDTTALTLTYTWHLLARHPEIEARLHDELDTVLGGEQPTSETVRQLDYTDRVLSEAMRLYPPVYTLFRTAKEPVDLGGYRLPQGSLLMLPQWAIHRDSRWYDDPDTFDPDRWKPARRNERPSYSYFPFGAGPRSCIGKQLSLLEAKFIIGTVAQDYHLDLESTASFDFLPTLTLHPADPVEMSIRERQ